jgi:hypothetical protein
MSKEDKITVERKSRGWKADGVANVAATHSMAEDEEVGWMGVS